MPRGRDVDPCRVLLLLDCAAELVIFMAFFVAYAIPRGHMISDTLFAQPVYAAAMTMFIAFRILFGVLYLFGHRLVRVPEDRKTWLRNSRLAAWVGFGLTLAGWVWLCWHRDDANHLVGVAVFALGSLMYSLALIQVARLVARDRRLEAVHSALEYTAVGITVGLGLAFSVMWWQGLQQTFIVEHVAYVAQVGVWMVFFSFHWVEPPREGDEPYTEQYEMASVPQCQPLLKVWVQNQGV